MNERWVTLKDGRRIPIKTNNEYMNDLIRKQGSQIQLKDKLSDKGLNRPTKLGTIAGKEITAFVLRGEDTNETWNFDTPDALDRAYNKMQEVKQFDRKDYGYTERFFIDIETDTDVYEDYILTKYKGKYKLKPYSYKR